ncbi:MAG: LytR/AlgR family response regulator transcription factor [Flammeovirgaceae bacterium]
MSHSSIYGHRMFSIKGSTRIILLGISCFVLINLFEAAQQHYYITRFQLANEEVSYWLLLKNHSLRWLIWATTSVLLYRYVVTYPIRQAHFNLQVVGRYALVVGSLLVITLVLISGLQVAMDGVDNTWQDYLEYLQFYTYQKAALFTSAYLGLIILIHLNLHQNELELKVVELSGLKKEYKQLYQDLKNQAFQDGAPLIHVKIGNKMKAIPLAEIVWIKSEDYCVRIHTKNGQSFLLRKSMKAMERELAAQGFVRIHRNSIVNLAEVDAFEFQGEPQVSLKQGDSLKIAASRVPQIKEALKLV